MTMTAETGNDGGRVGPYVRIAVDALAYAAVVVAGTLVLSLVVGLATGGGLVHAKVLLFLAGWLFLAIATVRLWPRSPEKGGGAVVRGNGEIGGPARRTRIEAIAGVLPPLRWMRSPRRRLSPATKLLVGSVFVLLASLTLEVVFAVG